MTLSIASSRRGLQTLIDLAVDFFGARNLFINAEKSQTLSLRPNGKDKKTFVDTSDPFSAGDDTIPVLLASSKWKYLGVMFDIRGNVTPLCDNLGSPLDSIRRAPLKPQQRLHILKFFLLPRFTHSLSLSVIATQQLLKLDRLVRGSVRDWLRLPHDTPSAFFHADSSDGGLAIPSFRRSIPKIQLGRLLNISASTTAPLTAVAASSDFAKKIRRTEKLCREGQFDLSSRDAIKSFFASTLHSQNDGIGLAQCSECPSALTWTNDGSSLLSGKNFILATKLRINALPTRSRTTRGRNLPDRCRAGCDSSETLAHVLQGCPRTHSTRVKRHDRIVQFAACELKSKGHNVLVEPHFQTDEGLRKPDLIVHNGDTVVVLDAQVVSDRASLEDRHKLKSAYYSRNPSLRRLLMREFKCLHVFFSSITVNWRGCLSASSAKSLLELGFPARSLKIISLRAVEGSLSEWAQFNMSTDMF